MDQPDEKEQDLELEPIGETSFEYPMLNSRITPHGRLAKGKKYRGT